MIERLMLWRDPAKCEVMYIYLKEETSCEIQSDY